MRIAIIAGEISGDILGSRLISALKKHYPDAQFEGIGGPEMIAQGFNSYHLMDRLSIMGYIEVLPRYLELRKMRSKLIKDWLKNPPDIFIGIDAPDFNLKIEKDLHKAGILAVHYVSPSIWAWKQGRVKRMIGSMNLMLTLFPFEVDFYKQHNVPAIFVGHPLADEIPLKSDQASARQELDLEIDSFVLAILPGSRISEIKRLAPDFLKAALLAHKAHPDWKFVTPLANKKVAKLFNEIKQEVAPDLLITQIEGNSRTVMTASDQILMASGTAVLEGMLVGRPMIAAYRVAPLTARIIRLFDMIKSDYFTLPNNLANEELVPEIIQEDISPESLFNGIEKQFTQSQEKKDYTIKRFKEIHQSLRQNASKKAALAIQHLLEKKNG